MAIKGIRPLMRRARTMFCHVSTDQVASLSAQQPNAEHEEKTPDTTANSGSGDVDAGLKSEVPTEGLQHGVSDAEAVTLAWSKTTLVAVFINIWLLYFVNAFQSSVYDSLSPYVSSYFEYHSLSGLPTAIGDACAAAVFLPTAKLMDTWGRAEGFFLMTCCATLGLILLASCDSFAVYCAAYVFYSLGFMGMSYCVDVVTADASKLKNRALAYAFTSSPYIITAFAGPTVAQEFHDHVGWRWGFGAWAIVFPIVAAPLYFMLKFNLRKAERQGRILRESSGRTFLQNIWYWFIQLDVFGVLIFTIGLVLFELPFDIADYATHGWRTGYIIAMIVVGFLMLFLFAAYENWFAPVPLFERKFLMNRTVLGACLLDATYQLSNYCWNNYFTSFLQVVNDLTVAEAGYVSHTFDIVSGVLLLSVGWAIRKTGRYKWLLYISVPLYIFAHGLMIYFRKPNMSVGYQVMCQIFIAIGGSIFIIVEQLSILAAVDHQHFATALALLNVVGTIGDSAGLTICMAIWQNTYAPALLRYLPEEAMSNYDDIYNRLDIQVSYPVGNATRTAIQEAYAYAEVRLLSVGCGIMVLAIAWTIMIKDIDLKSIPQVKGTVF